MLLFCVGVHVYRHPAVVDTATVEVLVVAAVDVTAVEEPGDTDALVPDDPGDAGEPAVVEAAGDWLAPDAHVLRSMRYCVTSSVGLTLAGSKAMAAL